LNVKVILKYLPALLNRPGNTFELLDLFFEIAGLLALFNYFRQNMYGLTKIIEVI
jgi:hypothetical protein